MTKTVLLEEEWPSLLPTTKKYDYTHGTFAELHSLPIHPILHVHIALSFPFATAQDVSDVPTRKAKCRMFARIILQQRGYLIQQLCSKEPT